MIATLRLEAIGDSCVALGDKLRKRQITSIPQLQPYKATFVFDPGRRPWVARIAGVNQNGKLIRKFVEPNKDYRDAKKSGDRGVYCTFVLRAGNVYEVHELLTWAKRRRYFCFVDSTGDLQEITLEEAVMKLSSSSANDAMQGIIGKAAGGE